jgi:type IV pilus assembly protein PilB
MEEDFKLEKFLLKQKRGAEKRAAQRRAEKYGLNYLDLVSIKTPTEIKAMELVKEEDARKALLVPVKLAGKKLVIAVYDPQKPETKKIIEGLEKNYDLTIFVTSKSGLKNTWGYYKYIKEESDEITGSVKINPKEIENLKNQVKTLENFSSFVQNFQGKRVSKILETILGGAISLQSSDIHLEPGEEKNTLRVRIDGMLHNISSEISEKVHKSLVTRIKLLSNLKLNVRDEAQDGRFTINLPNRAIEIRTSIIPSEYGETVVLRLLDPEALKINMEELGWREDDLEIIKKEINKPNGLILNTGPTGSGKTTTLYSFLRKRVDPKIKIITIEDPIEYHLEGISQTQVDKDSDYTFASGLRSILRQDPDVILVGEIRDEETTSIALNASLTGHMVFSTLHTNHAVGAIPRLLDLGAKPNILGPAISVIIAQRLVRKLCEKCKKPVESSGETKEKLNSFLEKLPNRVNKENYKNPEIYESNPKGCKECNYTGYKKRTSIFEIILVTDRVEEEIYKNPTEIQLRKLAQEEGMVSMQEDGILKVIKGLTDFKEIERLTGPIDWSVY